MFRKLRQMRKISTLLHSLLIGVAAASAIVPTSAVVIGCEDDKQPEYYVKRINNPVMRPQSVKRLSQFFEDAMTRAEKDRSNPDVVALLDKIVPPLNKAYLEDAGMDERSKTDIIQLLADTRDIRAKDSWIKAVRDYTPNVSEQEMKSAAKAIAETKVTDREAMDALIAAFVKFQAGSQKGIPHYKDVNATMIQISSPTWASQLVERLNRPMVMPDRQDPKAPEKIATFQNELMWQVTAAEILGNIREVSAIKPLFKTVIDPNKGNVAATAVMALVKIGKASSNALLDALLGNDEELLTYTKEVTKKDKEAQTALTRNAALVIGTIGRSDGIDAMVLAIGKTDKQDTETLALLAREIAKLPPTPESEKAFGKVFESTPMSTTLPPSGDIAAATLADSFARFYDPAVIEILAKRVDAQKDKEDKDMLRDSVLPTMIKLMRTPDQVKLVENFVAKHASGKDEAKPEKETLEKTKALLTECEEKIECYLNKLSDAKIQEKEMQFSGIKAAYMVAMLGSKDTANEIVKRIPSIKNGAIKFAAGQALEYLCPDGNADVADELGKQIAANLAKGDQNLIAGDAALNQMRYRLMARGR